MPNWYAIKRKVFPCPPGWSEEENDSAIYAFLTIVMIIVMLGIVMLICQAVRSLYG